jgi:hypothetical protein
MSKAASTYTPAYLTKHYFNLYKISAHLGQPDTVVDLLAQEGIESENLSEE